MMASLLIRTCIERQVSALQIHRYSHDVTPPLFSLVDTCEHSLWRLSLLVPVVTSIGWTARCLGAQSIFVPVMLTWIDEVTWRLGSQRSMLIHCDLYNVRPVSASPSVISASVRSVRLDDLHGTAIDVIFDMYYVKDLVHFPYQSAHTHENLKWFLSEAFMPSTVKGKHLEKVCLGLAFRDICSEHCDIMVVRVFLPV